MASRKPFTVTSPALPRIEVQRYVPPAPPQVIDEARQKGVNVIDHVHTLQAPEHPTPGGQRGVGEELPSIPALPVRSPMRLNK